MIALAKAPAVKAVGAVVLTLACCVAEAQQRGSILVPHPSWDCYLPDGIPFPEDGTPIFEIEIPLERIAAIGTTPFGERTVAVGLQGTVDGPRLSGTVMEGGLDFMLTLPNGTIEIEQILVLQATDGSYVLARNAGTGPDAGDVRIVMDFEAPNESEHAWLNSGTYVARRDLDESASTRRPTRRSIARTRSRSRSPRTCPRSRGTTAKSPQRRRKATC
jgi:hypothetical protein